MRTRIHRVNAKTALLAVLAMLLSLSVAAMPALPATAALPMPGEASGPPSVGADANTSGTGTNPVATTTGPSGQKGGGKKPKGGNTGNNPSAPKPNCTDVKCSNISYWQNWSTSHTYFFPAQPPSQLVAIGPAPGGTKASYNSKCSGSSAFGKYLGVTTAQNGRTLYNPLPRASRQTSASYTCIDPPHYTDSTRKCAATIGATAILMYSPVLPRSTVFNSGPSNSPFAASGYKDLSKCATAYRQSFNVALKQLGQYRLSANGYQTACTVRHYTTKNAQTGVTPPDAIVGCAGQYPYSHSKVDAQVWCNGWSLDWSGKHLFTPEECESVAGQWSCGVSTNKVPTFNGVLVPAAGIGVLGDGAKRAATWAGPTLTGPSLAGGHANVRNKQVEVFVDPGSTPYRAGQSPNGSTQPFFADRSFNTPLVGWGSIWNVGFQEASLPGATWRATPTWFFTADFKTTTIRSITVDWNTGAVTATTTSKYVPGTAECGGKPVTVSVNRARNTR